MENEPIIEELNRLKAELEALKAEFTEIKKTIAFSETEQWK